MHEALSHKKHACKVLMKLTLGVNFINILCKAFTSAYPKRAKMTVKLSFFTLLGLHACKDGDEFDYRCQQAIPDPNRSNYRSNLRRETTIETTPCL
jgi:hypothetical protein